MSDDAKPLPIYEAEAAGVLRRAHGHATALSRALDEAACVLAMAGLDGPRQQLEKLRELERLITIRVELLAKRVAKGQP